MSDIAELEQRIARLEELAAMDSAHLKVMHDLLVHVTRHHPEYEEVVADFVARHERFQSMALNSRMDLDRRREMLQLAHENLLQDVGVDLGP